MSDIEEQEQKTTRRPKRQDKRKETSKNNIKKAIEARKMRLKEQRDNRKDKEAEDQVKFIEEEDTEEEESNTPDTKEFTQEEIQKIQQYYAQQMAPEEELEEDLSDAEEDLSEAKDEAPAPKPHTSVVTRKRQSRKKVVNIKPPKLPRGRKAKIQEDDYSAQPSRLVEEVGEMKKIIQDMKIAKERQKQKKRQQVLSSKRAQKGTGQTTVDSIPPTKPASQIGISIEEFRKNLYKTL